MQLCTWLWQIQCACWKAEAPKQGQVQKAKTQQEQQKQQQQRLKLRKQSSFGDQSGHVMCCRGNEERMYTYFKGSAKVKSRSTQQQKTCLAQQ